VHIEKTGGFEMKKFTLDSFIKLKAVKDKQFQEPIVVEVDGEQIEVKKLSAEKVLDIMRGIDNEAPMIELCDQLIYEAIPELHQKNVLEEFDCKDNPVGVVGKIFSYGTRVLLGEELRSIVADTNLEIIKN
jgi:hypothetical protein